MSKLSVIIAIEKYATRPLTINYLGDMIISFLWYYYHMTLLCVIFIISLFNIYYLYLVVSIHYVIYTLWVIWTYRVLGWGVYGLNRRATWAEATWSGLLPFGADTCVPSLYRHLMSLNSQPPLLSSQSMRACCYHLTTCFAGILMGMGRTRSQSHHQSNNGGFRPEP